MGGVGSLRQWLPVSQSFADGGSESHSGKARERECSRKVGTEGGEAAEMNGRNEGVSSDRAVWGLVFVLGVFQLNNY